MSKPIVPENHTHLRQPAHPPACTNPCTACMRSDKGRQRLRWVIRQSAKSAEA
jgi:hypothetical protein